MTQLNNIPSDSWHYLRREIDSTDFQNENLTTKIRRNKAEKSHFFLKKIFENILTQTKQSNTISN